MLKFAIAADAGACHADLGGVAHAQNYPTKPIHVFVTSTAGGPLDVFTRLVTNKMEERPQAAVRGGESRRGWRRSRGRCRQGGAAGRIYDPVLDRHDVHRQSKPVQANPVRPGEGSSFQSRCSPNSAQALGRAGRPAGPIRQGAAGFIVAERSQLRLAGIGAPSHLSFAYLQAVTGIRATHVPYRGNPPALLALVSGETQASMVISTSLLPMVKEGKVRMLAYSDSVAVRGHPRHSNGRRGRLQGLSGGVLICVAWCRPARRRTRDQCVAGGDDPCRDVARRPRKAQGRGHRTHRAVAVQLGGMVAGRPGEVERRDHEDENPRRLASRDLRPKRERCARHRRGFKGLGAPRSMKMGAISLPWRYDVDGSHTLRSPIPR